MITRIYAVLLQEFFLTRRRLEIIIDLFWFSGMSIVVFGFVARFLVGQQNKEAASFLLVGLILWEVIRVGQYSLSVGPLWNIWSRNLSNLFRTPLSPVEYIAALMISATIKSFLVLTLNVFIAAAFFNFNILQLGVFNVIFYFFSLLLFSFSIGILILGFIFRFGTRIQALAWGFVKYLIF